MTKTLVKKNTDLSPKFAKIAENSDHNIDPTLTQSYIHTTGKEMLVLEVSGCFDYWSIELTR
jgi:hypothetical protein